MKQLVVPHAQQAEEKGSVSALCGSGVSEDSHGSSNDRCESWDGNGSGTGSGTGSWCSNGSSSLH